MLSGLSYPLFQESNNNLSPNCIDIVSDLHIDQWDSSLNIKNPCGEVVDKPYEFMITNNKILIVAGDISDDIDVSLNYLNQISENYERIIFVDGNHEHVAQYPNLLSCDKINNLIKSYDNDKIIYLPEMHYKLDKTVFIGFNGWWDYDKKNEDSIKVGLRYFDEWIPSISQSDNGTQLFIDNVIEKSEEQQNKFREMLEYYEKDNEVENVVIISHTIPIKQFALESDGNTDTIFQLQSDSKHLVDGRYKKLKTWIFGHTHHQFDETIGSVRFISNPRGRPEDFNRVNFDLKEFK